MLDELVSIVIPTYNMAKFLADAIDSAIAQTYQNKEIIIVDDGSTDETFSVVTRYLDSPDAKKWNITYYKKENGKTASALNYGIKKAKGEWIHWLSADDMLLPTAIETMFQYIRQYPEQVQNDAIFFSNWYMIDENGIKLYDFVEPKRDYESSYAIRFELIQHFIGNGSSSMIHKNVFAKCGMFDETIPVCEDYEFWLRAVMLNDVKLLAVPEFTLRYRAHSSNLSRQWQDKELPIVNKFKRR